MQAHSKLSTFCCQACKGVMTEPVCTPCGHNFCKACLVGRFATQDADAAASKARSTRVRKVPKPCPQCSANLFEFVGAMQVNQARNLPALCDRLHHVAC